ncbi:hypothetical protein BJ912DRAFT_1093663 [Pholiota molesta]|nr:hypothetical protein BJ912DRAFT_1093663 [Pholiota molesta]
MNTDSRVSTPVDLNIDCLFAKLLVRGHGVECACGTKLRVIGAGDRAESPHSGTASPGRTAATAHATRRQRLMNRLEAALRFSSTTAAAAQTLDQTPLPVDAAGVDGGGGHHHSAAAQLCAEASAHSPMPLGLARKQVGSTLNGAGPGGRKKSATDSGAGSGLAPKV